MKIRRSFFRGVLAAFTMFAVLGGCDAGNGESPFLLELPSLPPSWTELLGPPRWLVKYYDGGGVEVILDIEGETAEISTLPSRPSPVSAWPYWPLRRLKPGDFRPAGAILPYGINGKTQGRISLSWQGGVEACFFEAMNRAALNNTGSPDIRRGEYFDWPAFQALFSDPAVPADFRSDPWRADWDAIAERTVRSGFRKRLLAVAEALPLAVPAGSWVSPSPFAPTETGTVKVRDGTTVQVWYSAGGILHCAGAAWILLPWD
ncbi:MAG: hypothetical protein LBP20_07875 [Treponema sp.]|jgi:hypothetical protein|nr:hypothetical protein [Treponema sp.]